MRDMRGIPAWKRRADYKPEGEADRRDRQNATDFDQAAEPRAKRIWHIIGKYPASAVLLHKTTQTEHSPHSLPYTMIIKKLLSTILLGSFVALTACSHNRTLPPEKPVDTAVPLASITLLPIDSPDALFTDNRSFPVVGFVWTGLANTIMDKSKSAEFDTQHQRYRQQIGEKFTQALRRELQALGFTIRMASRSEIRRTEQGDMNMRAFAGHDAMLDVQISEFAMCSRRLRFDYQPMITGWFSLIKPANSEDLMNSWFSYGTYATYTGDGYIQSDPRYSFPSFESLINQSGLAEEGFDEGIQKIAANFAKELRKQYKPVIRLARAEDDLRPAGRIVTTGTSAQATMKRSKAAGKPIPATAVNSKY